jgi:hypothetical protein
MFKWLKKKFEKPAQDERRKSADDGGRPTTPAPVNGRDQGVQASDQLEWRISERHITPLKIVKIGDTEEVIPGSLMDVKNLPQIDKPVTITIDGKLYSSLSAEEVSEILKYVGEQLRAKK